MRGTAGQVSRLPMTGSPGCSARAGRAVQKHGPHRGQGADDQRGPEQSRQKASHPTTVAWPDMTTLRSIAPIFPTADMDAMQAHYEALGFSVHVHGGGYGTAARDDVRIHFRHVPGLAATGERGAAYIGVDDADALHAEWVAAEVGETTDLFDPGFGVWEAAHTDRDGNLVRFGSSGRS